MAERRGQDASTLAIVVTLVATGAIAGIAVVGLDSLLYASSRTTFGMLLYGVAKNDADTAWVMYTVVGAVVGGLTLWALIRPLTGIELTLPGGIVVRLVGALPGLLLTALYHPTAGLSAAFALVSPLSAVMLVATYGIQVLLIRSLDGSGSRSSEPSAPPSPAAPWEQLRDPRRPH